MHLQTALLFGALALAPTVAAYDKVVYKRIQVAHGVLAPLAFALLFPLGAIYIRLTILRNRNIAAQNTKSASAVWIHAAWMGFAYAIVLAALGMGLWMALVDNQLKEFHSIIGLVVIALLAAQPFTGLAHHLIYRRTVGVNGTRAGESSASSITPPTTSSPSSPPASTTTPRRNPATIPHVWWGRAIITLGIINGGLGLQLSHHNETGEMAYGVLAGVVWCLWMGVLGWSWYVLKKDEKNKTVGGEKERSGSDSSLTKEGKVVV